MEDTNQTDDGRQPLWKQLLGAVIGGGLALALYYGYEYAKPKVTAYLTLPPADRMYDLGAANIADKTTDEGNRKRLLSRNARVAQQMEGYSAAPDLLDTVDDHSLDIAWPGHDPSDPKYTEVTGVMPEPEEDTAMMKSMDMEPDMAMEDSKMHINNDLFASEVLTKEMAMNDDWDSLWGDIRSRETRDERVERSDAEALPDTGFGLGAIIAGATGGALASRKRKRKMA